MSPKAIPSTHQHISTARSLDVAKRHAARDGAAIIAIDLNKVPEYMDVSTQEAASASGMTMPMVQNFAAKDLEVLVPRHVPRSAILDFVPLPE